MTKNKDISSYTIEDIATALRIEYKICTRNKSPELNPKAYILGGQGGAGKSTLQEMFVEFHSNTICINGDEYRKYHPRFKEIQSKYGNEAANYTQSFANAVANALVEELTFEGYNIVIEGTCRRADVPLKQLIPSCVKHTNNETKCVLKTKDTTFFTTSFHYQEQI